jgi:hypothetical protein
MNCTQCVLRVPVAGSLARHVENDVGCVGLPQYLDAVFEGASGVVSATNRKVAACRIDFQQQQQHPESSPVAK